MKKEKIDSIFIEEAKLCANEIKNGKVLLYPAETLWGLGCNALDIDAVKRIFTIKNRPNDKSLITLVSSWRMLQNVVSEIPQIAEEILELSNEPITIIYPKANSAYKHLSSENGNIAVRLIETGFVSDIIEKTRTPLVSTSANLSGERNSGLFNDIPQELIEDTDYVANPDLPYEMTGKASKMIKIELDGRIEILR